MADRDYHIRCECGWEGNFSQLRAKLVYLNENDESHDLVCPKCGGDNWDMLGGEAPVMVRMYCRMEKTPEEPLGTNFLLGPNNQAPPSPRDWGVGKSRLMKQAAKKQGFKVVDIPLEQHRTACWRRFGGSRIVQRFINWWTIKFWRK